MFWGRRGDKRKAADEREALLEGVESEEGLKDRLVMAVLSLQREHLAVERSRVFWQRIRYMTMIVPLVAMGVYFMFAAGINQIQQEMKGYVALVELSGTISDSGNRSGRMLASSVINSFEDENARGVVIRVNSGGGQAMQSALIRDAIDNSRREYPEKRVIVVAEDIMASGAYLVASGAHEIYAHPMTMVGSIGAKMESWGFSDALERLGVEHRSFSAGEHKTRLSPYRELSTEDGEKASQLVSDIHSRFIEYVQTGRGERLKAPPEVVFSGDIWLGQEALNMGLIDGFGTIREVMLEAFDTDRVLDFTPAKGWRSEAPAFIAETLTHIRESLRASW